METITNSLEMTFQASAGSNVKVTLYDQKADLTSETVLEAIKTIKAMKITEGLPRGTADANITPVS